MKFLWNKFITLTKTQLLKGLFIGYGVFVASLLLAIILGYIHHVKGGYIITDYLLSGLYYSVYIITAVLILFSARLYSLSQDQIRFFWQIQLIALVLFFPIIPMIWGMLGFGILAVFTFH